MLDFPLLCLITGRYLGGWRSTIQAISIWPEGYQPFDPRPWLEPRLYSIAKFRQMCLGLHGDIPASIDGMLFSDLILSWQNWWLANSYHELYSQIYHQICPAESSFAEIDGAPYGGSCNFQDEKHRISPGVTTRIPWRIIIFPLVQWQFGGYSFILMHHTQQKSFFEAG